MNLRHLRREAGVESFTVSLELSYQLSGLRIVESYSDRFRYDAISQRIKLLLNPPLDLLQSGDFESLRLDRLFLLILGGGRCFNHLSFDVDNRSVGSAGWCLLCWCGRCFYDLALHDR